MLVSRVLLGVLVWGTVGAGALSILAFVPFGSKSHHLVFDPLLRELLRRGHHVVSYKAFPLDDPPTACNYTEIIVPDFFHNEPLDFISLGQKTSVRQHLILGQIGQTFIERVMKWPGFQELLSSREHFDLILDEALFVQEAVLVLSHKFNAPQVTIMPLGNSPWALYVMDNPYNPSYIPDFFVVTSPKMNFRQRFLNSLASFAQLIIGDWYHVPKMQELVDRLCRYEGWESRPPLSVMVRNISLLVQNSHHSINGAAPLAPNVLSVGGIHIGQSKPLPPELQKWMDGAEHGVVYFSYGSILSEDLLENGLDEAIEALGRLPQRVVLKLRVPMRNLPRNVYASAWLPQQDILRHKNCVAFVSHGGYLSLTEAIYHGVPVVGTPFFGDQRKNLACLVEQGLGVQLEYSNLTQDSLLWAINEVLKPSYREAVRWKSEELLARPVGPLEEAVFWLERIGKNKGRVALRPAVASLTWYQALLLDVLTLFLIFSSITAFILYLLVTKIFHVPTFLKNEKIKKW